MNSRGLTACKKPYNAARGCFANPAHISFGGAQAAEMKSLKKFVHLSSIQLPVSSATTALIPGMNIYPIALTIMLVNVHHAQHDQGKQRTNTCNPHNMRSEQGCSIYYDSPSHPG
jgi:hypothetical protein